MSGDLGAVARTDPFLWYVLLLIGLAFVYAITRREKAQPLEWNSLTARVASLEARSRDTVCRDDLAEVLSRVSRVEDGMTGIRSEVTGVSSQFSAMKRELEHVAHDMGNVRQNIGNLGRNMDMVVQHLMGDRK